MLAGQAGTDDIDGLTLREIAWMAEGIDRAEHRRLTRLEAYIGSMLSKKPMRPGEMNPYRAKKMLEWDGKTRIRFAMNGVSMTKETFALYQERQKSKHARRK